MTPNADEGTRIDRWLWAIRLFKTRQIAAAAVKGGKVTLNGDRPKPAKLVRVGDELVVTKEGYRHHIKVLITGEKRVSAPIAATMYEESDASVAAREERSAQMKAANLGMVRGDGRPTKRDRRLLDDLKRGG